MGKNLRRRAETAVKWVFRAPLYAAFGAVLVTLVLAVSAAEWLFSSRDRNAFEKWTRRILRAPFYAAGALAALVIVAILALVSSLYSFLEWILDDDKEAKAAR